MRFCVQCKFCEMPAEGTYTCAAAVDMVTGAQKHTPCEDERSPVWAYAQCGVGALLFKQLGEMGGDPRKTFGEPPIPPVPRGSGRSGGDGRAVGLTVQEPLAISVFGETPEERGALDAIQAHKPAPTDRAFDNG